MYLRVDRQALGNSSDCPVHITVTSQWALWRLRWHVDCVLNRLFRRKLKRTSNPPVTVEFPSQRASNADFFPILWRHHDVGKFRWQQTRTKRIRVRTMCIITGMTYISLTDPNNLWQSETWFFFLGTEYRTQSPMFKYRSKSVYRNVSYAYILDLSRSSEVAAFSLWWHVAGAAPTGDAPITSEWSTISLPTKLCFILEVWR